MSEIKNLNPVCIWKNFYALTQVPRPSGHLEKVQNFLDIWRKYRISCSTLPSRQVWKPLRILLIT